MPDSVDNEPLLIGGAPGSPYTRKMLAVLRYRRLSYRFLTPSEVARRGLSWAKVPLLPTFWFPGPAGGLEPVTDSSPLIRRFERDFAGRAVVPPDPALAFLDALFEDYADEWLTKFMFHFRWAFEADIDRAARVLPHWRGLSRPDEVIAQASLQFAERQIGRLGVVGSNETTAAVIEAGYPRFLAAFDAHLRAMPYLTGARPGASDFAFFGQLTQLAQFDPTPMAITLERAPRVFAWVSLVEDLSGIEPEAHDWASTEAPPPTWRPILSEIGRTYVPVMLANARALDAGRDTVEATVDGALWRQRAFPYQGKCLRWLREAHAALGPAERECVDGILDGTGCEALFSEEIRS
ncbi:MAG: glutathione S-transferase C-terminal domain-containing protein [Burkholderiaceae bacterium]